MSRVFDIPLGDIVVGKRLRPLDPARVDLIADSMKRGEQLQPIEVSAHGKGKWLLVFGLHRLAAATKNSAPTIRGQEFKGDADARELREIEENLMRSDLNALDRAFAVERWCHHLGAIRKGGADEKSLSNQSFAEISKRIPAEVAERAGLSERAIYADLKLARLLAGVREKIADHPIAQNQADLMRLAKLDGPKRQKALAGLAAGKSFKEVNAPKAEIVAKKGNEGALYSAWKKASAADQDAFLKTAILGLTEPRRNALCAWIVAKGLMTKVPK